MIDKPYAPHTARNTAPILEVLLDEFNDRRRVLEIGSGTAQHAVAFAAAMPQLSWQTSDLDVHHEGMRGWLEAAALPNVLAPLSLDVRSARLPRASYDAAFSANTAHIMSIEAVACMFSLLAAALEEGGRFCLYGPFRQDGEFNTPSNRDFHASLRARNPEMGVRHLEDLDGFAARACMRRLRLYAMPANNFLAVWEKQTTGETM